MKLKIKAYVFLIMSFINSIVYAFPNHIPVIDNTNSGQIIEGCIGDCASCHSLTKDEAKNILSKKFDIKKIIQITVKRGYFQIQYLDSKNNKKLLNLLFSKDKVAPKIIELDKGN